MRRGTCRPARSGLGDVNLIDPVEQRSCVRCEDTRETGREAGADHDRQVVRSCQRVELEQRTHLVDIVYDRDHCDPRLCIAARETCVGRARSGEQGDGHAGVDAGCRFLGARRLGPRTTQRSHDRVDLLGIDVADHDAVDLVRGGELPGSASSDSAGADDDDDQCRFNGGRGRSARAIRHPAAAPLHSLGRAGSLRSRPRFPTPSRPVECFSPVGLAGIEPATSSLSGMRSNRLSYSPGVRGATLAIEPAESNPGSVSVRACPIAARSRADDRALTRLGDQSMHDGHVGPAKTRRVRGGPAR